MSTTTESLVGTDLTGLITDYYRETLADDSLHAESDFFEAGGDSLAGFQITARLDAALGIEVPVSLVFTYPSPADLAAVIESDFGL